MGEVLGVAVDISKEGIALGGGPGPAEGLVLGVADGIAVCVAIAEGGEVGAFVGILRTMRSVN